MQRARSGVGLMVIKSQAPVVPVRIFGTFEAYNRRHRWPRPRSVAVKFGEPIRFESARAEAAHCSRARLKQIYQEVADDIMRGLYGDGIIALPRAFPTAFADRMHDEITALFEEARGIPGGTLPRGPERWYVEVQPERISGFVDIATHPWFVAVCECVLGSDYRIVEIGFDIPFPGAADQPWHRQTLRSLLGR